MNSQGSPIWIVHQAGEPSSEGQFCQRCGADLFFGQAHPIGDYVVRHVAFRPGDGVFTRKPGELEKGERMCDG